MVGRPDPSTTNVRMQTFVRSLDNTNTRSLRYATEQMYVATFTPIRDLQVIGRRRPAQASARRARNVLVGLGTFVFMGVVLAQSAHGSAPTAYDTVRVQPGQTLWGIAADRYPGADTRAKVGEIMKANGLQGVQLSVGEELRVPSS